MGNKVKEIYVNDYNVAGLACVVSENEMRYIGGNLYLQDGDNFYRLMVQKVPLTREEFLQMNEVTY